MTETDESKPAARNGRSGLSRPGRLELKKTVDSGQVRQSFSHGRSKMVTVEVRKKRTFAPDARGRMAEVKEEPRLAPSATGSSVGLVEELREDEEGLRAAPIRGLTTEEKAARARALEDAMRAGEADDATAVEPRAVVAGDSSAADVEEIHKAEEERRRTEDEEQRRRDGEEAQRVEEQAKAAAATAAAKLQAREDEAPEEDARGVRRPGRPDLRRHAPGGRRQQPRRRAGKLTIAEALGDDEERMRSLASVKRARERERQKQLALLSEGQKVFRDVVVPETITVQELANRMAERSAAVVKTLMNMGVMATATQSIDADTAELVVAEFGHNMRRVSEADVEIGLTGGEDEETALGTRPPVVTVMGHVDHGKTTLLDALRETDVASREAGGITQHIGAYQVAMPSGARITFIDTPGHEAFTEMRSRGARVTDIVVLCVAADDGVMPQTVEAIHHAKAANVPIVVAINKIDRPDSDPLRVRTELLQHDVAVESMGGEVLAVEVSALERTNLDKLEDVILLQAELLDLKANPDRPAEGVVVEARMEQGRGSVGTVLVQRGTLHIGDIFIAGNEWGRVRALVDAHGEALETAGPSLPVEIIGLNGTPAAGDDFVVVDSEPRAREVSEFRQRRQRSVSTSVARATIEQMFERMREGEAQALPVVIKADVHGSVEAIIGAIEKLSTDEVRVEVLHSGVGGINESDVTLARASDGLVVGFNVRANPQARNMARRDDVAIRYYSIIYEVTDDVKQMLSGMLAPAIKENTLGYAEVRKVFSVSKVGWVAGCVVSEGLVRRGAKVRLVRDQVVIHEGELSQLKRFKDDVREVRDGTECGMAFANYQDIREGDVIECFEVEEVARAL